MAAATVQVYLDTAQRRLGVESDQAALEVCRRLEWWDDIDLPLGGNPAPSDEGPRLSPFVVAYLSEFDRWLTSGMTDKNARAGMLLALAGHRNATK